LVTRDQAFGQIKTATTTTTSTESEMLAKFERFLKYVKTPPLADYSVQGELRNVRQFIRNYGATEPTEELANKIREHCRSKNRSKNTERLYLFTLENWYESVHGKRLGLKKPTASGWREVCIKPEEFRRMLANCTNHGDKALLATLFYSCGRRKEIVNLCMRDVEISLCKIWVRDNGDVEDVKFGGTKNHKEEYIPIHDDLKPILDEWLEFRRKDGAVGTSPVFPNVYGERYSLDGFTYLVRKLTKQYIGTAYGPHAFRHSGSTFYGTNGNMNEFELREITRQSDIRTLQRYVHPTKDGVRAKMNKISPLAC
jgi:integrase